MDNINKMLQDDFEFLGIKITSESYTRISTWTLSINGIRTGTEYITQERIGNRIVNDTVNRCETKTMTVNGILLGLAQAQKFDRDIILSKIYVFTKFQHFLKYTKGDIQK